MDKAKNRRLYYLAVFYFLMILAGIAFIIADIHTFWKVLALFGIGSLCLFVREADHAPEIDPRIPMSPEEEAIKNNS